MNDTQILRAMHSWLQRQETACQVDGLHKIQPKQCFQLAAFTQAREELERLDPGGE